MNEATDPNNNYDDDQIITILEDLIGEKAPFKSELYNAHPQIFKERTSGIGYTQFNELLLSLGFNRITSAFFQFLIDGTNDKKNNASINSIDILKTGVERFKKVALLLFGNIRFAFRRLSTDEEDLNYWLAALEPIASDEYIIRHDPIHPIQEIAGEDTYYLGYVIREEISDRLKANPSDIFAKEEQKKIDDLTKIGIYNYHAYLASDHLDVYIATSMRERHEYCLVNEWINSIFKQEKLINLRLRWFDPTQAYCPNRIDKGLFEALMLKRAKCTIYFIQETDTLGKDSELASTLAQGKSVIAYVPIIDENYTENIIRKLVDLQPDKDEQKVLLNQLRIINSSGAWNDKEIMGWIINPRTMNISQAKIKLMQAMKEHYDKRADILSKTHPLGIQVNLDTGVANGVLVVRNISDCAELIHRVITRNLEFSIEEVFDKNTKYVYLRETISNCVYRVVTGDQMLTNTFWNFYINT